MQKYCYIFEVSRFSL